MVFVPETSQRAQNGEKPISVGLMQQVFQSSQAVLRRLENYGEFAAGQHIDG